MLPPHTVRSFSTGAVTFAAVTTMSSVAAMAACGAAATLAGLASIVGPPSITATETSTDQALELIRKRREEASGVCPPGLVRSGGNCVPAGAFSTPQPAVASAAPVAVTTTTTTGPAPAPAPAAASAPAAAPPTAASVASTPSPQRAATPRPVRQASAAPAAPSYGYTGGSIKDGHYDVPVPGVVRARGVWAETYWDQERRKNMAPNRVIPAFTANNNTDVPEQRINQARRTTSGGVVMGADVSQFTVGEQISGFQVGLFGGYNQTLSKLSDVTVFGQGINGATQTPDGLAITGVSADRQEVRGGFGGLYGTVVHGAFSADLAFKVDIFDVERSFVERFFFDPNCNPPDDIINTVTLRRDSTTMTNFTVASNANYRFDIGRSMYLEPTVGVRWTYSDFGGNAAALGLKDGDVFRVQGGLRLGARTVTPDGWVWNNSITGLLYSDVAINGYSTGAAGPGGLAALDPRIDEGKLRLMGILESRVDVGHGYTLYGMGEVRGGDDYVGYGARAGIRYQW